MKEVAIKLTVKEARLLRKYAKWHNMDISSVIQRAIIEKIAKGEDLSRFDAVYQQQESQGQVSLQELKKFSIH